MTVPFALAGDSATPLFLRIARAVITDIERGRLKAGAKMPGTRTLAADLCVHRKTVVAAYEELVLQGWITTRPSRGAIVALDLQVPDRSARPVPAARPETPSAVGGPSETVERPRLAFSDGTPDPRLLPRGELARAFRRALGSAAFLAPGGYGDPRGGPRLRAALAEWLAATRGLAIGADDILITRGSQMALFLAARAVADAGGAIAVEDPGYPLAWTAFRAAGARVVGVPVDAEGLDIAALDRLARRDRGIRAVLVTPHHHYPTTVTLGAGRRLALLKLAAAHGWTVIEDDYDHEYRYEGRPVLPLAAAAPRSGAGSVIYVGSLSKLLAPGLRLGYAIAAPGLIGRMATAREAIDRQGDVPLETAVAELMEDGELRRHARKARKTYLARRDLLVATLTHALGDTVSFDVPAGGLALWLRVRTDIDAHLWARRALDRGLRVPDGAAFALDRDHAPNAFRLGFAALDPAEMARAVQLLSEARPG